MVCGKNPSSDPSFCPDLMNFPSLENLETRSFPGVPAGMAFGDKDVSAWSDQNRGVLEQSGRALATPALPRVNEPFHPG
jgi:hypothetical protein